MIHQTLLSAFMFLSIASCTGQKALDQDNTQKTDTSKPLVISNNENTTKSDMENVIELNEGENKFLKGYEMNVTFQKVKEDSRCPKDVQCVWAGVATVNLQFMGTYTRPVNVELSTINDVKKGYSSYAIFNGYKISLVTLDPYPNSASDKKANTGKHKIKLQFVKIAENQIEPNVE